MIAKRHVLFLAGFDAIDIPSQHRRFQREAAKFAQTWQLSATVSDIGQAIDGSRWRFAVRAPNWATETVYEPLDWHEVVTAELGRSWLWLSAQGLWTFAEFVVTGTAYRYFAATWRYGLFFLVPFLNVLLFIVAAFVCGRLVADLVPFGPIVRTGVAFAVAIAAFALLLRWPGQRWRVQHALADWIFARDYMKGRRADFDARLDTFSDRLRARARANDCDEILVVGHSLGATLAVDIIARALQRDPEFAERGPTICLLTVGSTIPKLALHPAAKRLRASLTRVATHPRIVWTEFQARNDPISFFKFDPATLQRFTDNEPGRKPRIRLVGIKDMLAPESVERYKFNYMRKHYQFVMGNERRAIYDYFMLIGGPAPFALISGRAKSALDLFGEDGSYHEGQGAPLTAGVA